MKKTSGSCTTWSVAGRMRAGRFHALYPPGHAIFGKAIRNIRLWQSGDDSGWRSHSIDEKRALDPEQYPRLYSSGSCHLAV